MDTLSHVLKDRGFRCWYDNQMEDLTKVLGPRRYVRVAAPWDIPLRPPLARRVSDSCCDSRSTVVGHICGPIRPG